MATEGFSGREAADIVGITYRQLDYWARTDLIRPSLADAKGSGSRRRYAYKDLVECGSIAAARDKGLYRMEGKTYVVADGDVMLFKFNV